MSRPRDEIWADALSDIQWRQTHKTFNKRSKAQRAARRALKKPNVRESVQQFLDRLQRSAEHAATNPLRELSKDEKVTLRRAAKDLRLHGRPLVTLLKDTPGALDMLAPVLSAARVIGWFSGPQESARPFFEHEKGAKMRAKRGLARIGMIKDLVRAKVHNGRRLIVSDVTRRVNKELEKKGEKPTTRKVVKRCLRDLGRL